ncbi:beta-hexosaminidase subunit alpha-like isoform X2 [Mercenaria mercenaria]|nr:beta-hexosaminidase subunit alpha-like isoform X2 [Mercenaria mercenaria]
MNVWRVCVLVFILFSGSHMITQGKSAVDRTRSRNKASRKRLHEKDDPIPPNSYLDQFLREHSKPIVRLKSGRETSFELNIDSRYNFNPPIKTAPFSSTGEPWPLPKKYQSENEKVLKLDKEQFKIEVLNKSCDILMEAIKRYTKIIQNHIIEEHYEFVYNFDEKTFTDRKRQEERKYNEVENMPNLEIDVAEEDCGYPHIDMKESYTLVVRPDITRLTADQVWGAVRGLETFSQLLFRKWRTDEVYAKVTEIEDGPRFPHRGILMDTSRHYIHKNTIKNVLDGMAYNKMNVLHWHIVDDNSFPYQSEVFPKLSEKGAFHPDLVYTIDDIKELVEYARYRGIRVVPEFDTPGHTFSWLGYPEIKSTCYTGDTPLKGPMGPINPAQDKTYMFMSKLFSEIYNVFPDSFVHLGGDELHSTCWATNPAIRAYLQEHGNIPAYEARTNAGRYVDKAVGYYFKRLIETLETAAREKQQKKSFIMWEDVLKNTDKVPLDSILQVWMGRPSNVLSLNERGYRALYSSCWYLDHYKTMPMWPDYYNCDPSPYNSEAEEKGKILGGEACLWAEYITTDTLMSFMWPRASAPAERLWSSRSTTNIANAAMRLQEQRCRMIFRGLPTGHISGPDYCLRPKDGSFNWNEKDQFNAAAEPEAQFAVKNSKDENNISIFVLSQYHHYLPVMNIVLTLAGLYIIICVSGCRKRRGHFSIFQSNN